MRGAVILLVLAGPLAGQQVADTGFAPAIASPIAAIGRGPKVLLDEAHFNFHTIAGRYGPFVQLLRRDGFVVEPLRDRFTERSLAGAGILVIANAIAPVNEDNWKLPTPSAFTTDEIASVTEWVSAGGSLFLIADHMPFPGAAADLARAFGLTFLNGFAADSTGDTGEMTFRKFDGSLGNHPILSGRNPSERVDSVRSFTGQAFRASGNFTPILTLPAGTIVLLPVEAWEFSDQTPRLPADGLLQGAIGTFGRGRIAVFGEAAMFSAQLQGPNLAPMGMNAPGANQNPQFLLNILHWLAGLLPER
jgi:hypothetical protein